MEDFFLCGDVELNIEDENKKHQIANKMFRRRRRATDKPLFRPLANCA